MRVLTAAGLTLIALSVSACRLDVDTTILLTANDTADVTVAAAFDPALLERLDQLALDPFAVLQRANTFDWQLTRQVQQDGVQRLGLTRQDVAIDMLADVLESLSYGLGDTDVGLFFDVDVRSEGRIRTIEGTVLFAPPTNQGVFLDGLALGLPSRLIADQIARDVDMHVTLAVEGTILSHNGVTDTDTSVRWRLPVNESVAIDVTVELDRQPSGLGALGLLIAVFAGGGAWLVWRSRTPRLPPAPTEAVVAG